jgi:hypothetical protein
MKFNKKQQNRNFENKRKCWSWCSRFRNYWVLKHYVNSSIFILYIWFCQNWRWQREHKKKKKKSKQHGKQKKNKHKNIGAHIKLSDLVFWIKVVVWMIFRIDCEIQRLFWRCFFHWILIEKMSHKKKKTHTSNHVEYVWEEDKSTKQSIQSWFQIEQWSSKNTWTVQIRNDNEIPQWKTEQDCYFWRLLVTCFSFTKQFKWNKEDEKHNNNCFQTMKE